VAEQLILDQFHRQAGAVDWYDGAVRARAVLMDVVGVELRVSHTRRDDGQPTDRANVAYAHAAIVRRPRGWMSEFQCRLGLWLLWSEQDLSHRIAQ
jgi:hypothetical protein